MRTGNLIVISGPSGCGKSTIIRNLLKQDKLLAFSVSATTRPMRKNETEGKDYYFLTDSEFSEKIREGAFYEYATIYNNRYGTLKSDVEMLKQAGYDVVLDIDTQGARQLMESNAHAIYIFVLPPSFEELEHRLTKRGSDSPEQIVIRLSQAQAECELSSEYDYAVVNADVSDTTLEVLSIIQSHRSEAE
ncbi:MAG: guanylate kinase [Eubacteriaceae bacterium]|nr:guanylate kinase [Eubacteriaceae bacterium]